MQFIGWLSKLYPEQHGRAAFQSKRGPADKLEAHIFLCPSSRKTQKQQNERGPQKTSQTALVPIMTKDHFHILSMDLEGDRQR
jgi:hypothetical protein